MNKDIKKREKSLKIAMLGHKNIPSREGGIEVVVSELATRMAILGHQVTCYNRKKHNIVEEEYKDDVYKGVKLISVFTINKKGLAALTSSFFASLHAAFGDYDIVHYHAEGPSAMMWIAKLRGKRCIATVHGLDWKREKWNHGLGAKYIKFGEKILVKYADEIIVLSESMKNYFLNEYNRKTVVIPNGIDKPKNCTAKLIKEKFGLEKNEYYCYLGRLTEEKGIHYLIEAYKKVRTNKKLVIAGASSDTDDYVEKIRNMAKGDSRIIFTGFVQGDILREIYSNLYVYILPSNVEGMPLSLLEAMSYGNCVIGSSIDEIKEVIEDKGIIFDKGNVNDLKEKIEYLDAHPEVVEEYRNKTCDFICKKYNWDDITKRTIELYKKDNIV